MARHRNENGERRLYFSIRYCRNTRRRMEPRPQLGMTVRTGATSAAVQFSFLWKKTFREIQIPPQAINFSGIGLG
jgi:hypothetical protein